MSVITSDIGAAADYTDLGAWEADTYNSATGTDDAVANVLNEVIVEGADLTINDSTPQSVTVTVAEANRHDGTPGSGARWVMGGDGRELVIQVGLTLGNVVMEFYEIDVNSHRTANTYVISLSDSTEFKDNLVHGRIGTSNETVIGVRGSNSGTELRVWNNIIFDLQSAGTGTAYGIQTNTAGTTAGKVVDFSNNTITDLRSPSTGDSYGIEFTDDSDHLLKNNLVTDVAGGATSGTEACYANASPSNIVHATNLSDDASSPDSGLRSKSITFADAGSQDYHLASGDTDAIDAGTDLGSVANVDIDGRDRDAQGDTWDVGADEFVSAGGGGGHAPFPPILLNPMIIGSMIISGKIYSLLTSVERMTRRALLGFKK